MNAAASRHLRTRQPALLEAPALYVDGITSVARPVRLRLSGAIDIVEGTNLVARWNLDDIRRIDGPTDSLRLSCTAAPGSAHLDIADGAMKLLLFERCPSLDAGASADRAALRRFVLWVLGAAGLIVGLVALGLPLLVGGVTMLVPSGVERRLGAIVDRQIAAVYGDRICASDAGDAALGRLVDLMKREAGIARPVTAQVLRTSVPNAFTLPGGKIYLTDGLLRAAESPDEAASVLAHELGHIAHRDNLRRILSDGGAAALLGFVLGDAAGSGATEAVARNLLRAAYSRDAERSADRFAVDLMRGLGRSPRPFADILLRIAGAQRDTSLSILARHPMTEERLALVAREDRPETGEALLPFGEWRALKEICDTGP